MTTRRSRIGILSLSAALVGFLFVTFQPWIGLERIILFGGLSLRTLLSAFFDASLVGALADWFAVTALFRNPLGVRLPHTDILARNKDAIAEAVPRFLTSFVSEEKIAAELGAIDYAGKIESLLRTDAARGGINEFLRARIAALLANVGGSGAAPSEGFTTVVREIVAYAGEKVDPGRTAGALLRWARREGIDERLIEGAAEALQAGIAGNVESLTDTLTRLVKKNAGWQGIFVGRGTVERLLRGALEELDRVRADPAHTLRVLLASRLLALSSRLSGESPDPDAMRERIHAWYRRLIEDPLTGPRVSRFLVSVLDHLRAAVQPGSTGLVRGVERIEEVFVSQLRANPEFRGSYNRAVASFISNLIASSGLIEGVTGYLAGLLKNTDEREFVGRIEDAVWNDLQYIRVNGAVVGGIVGIALAIVSALVHR